MIVSKIYVIIYNDKHDFHVGVDVFDSFEKALDQFDATLSEVREMHEDDPGWVVDLQRSPRNYNLYFETKEGYEVFLRVEPVL